MQRSCGFALRFLAVCVGTVYSQTCPADETTEDMTGPFYLPNAPLTDRIAPEDQLSDPSNVLFVQGHVYGQDCLPISNALVEAWYAGVPDANGNYYSVAGSDLSYRGRIQSDECGFYHFTQTFPEIYASRPILHVHFRVSSNDQLLLTTQMYFENMIPDSFSMTGRDLQIVSVEEAPNSTRSVVFDIHVDAPGTANAEACNITVTESSPTASSPQSTPSANAGNGSNMETTSSAWLLSPSVRWMCILLGVICCS